MKKSRFSEEQIVKILRETDKEPVAEVARRHSVSEQSIYAWKKRYGAMQENEVKRLRTLEAENSRLKRLLAEKDLQIDVLREINEKKW